MTATEFAKTNKVVLSLYHGPRELWYRTFGTVEACREYLAANKPAAKHRYSLPLWQFVDSSGDRLPDELIHEVRVAVFGDSVE